MVVADQKMLGLMIRGGNEFGLGIYITGVDSGSVAENAGLKVSSCYPRMSGSVILVVLWNLHEYYSPPTKLRKGNVFTRVCLSVHRGGGSPCNHYP